MVRGGELALWRTSWIGDYPDPENFMALFITENIAPRGPNTTRINRGVLDSLYSAALDPSLPFESRSKLYNEMESVVIREAPWVFLYHDVLIRLVQPNVKGFRLDGSGRLVLESVRK
jgi:peptide/nickel transport system substrate-binding protein